MEFEGMELLVPDDFEEEMTVLATLKSPAQAFIGILIAGEDYQEKAKEPVIRIYLLALEDQEWHIADELHAFAFSDYASAQRFVDDLPDMSAIDLLLLINGYQSNQQHLQ